MRQVLVVPQALAVIAVVRPVTCLLAATSAACGGYFAAGADGLLGERAVLAMVCMAGLLGVANTVNDIVDLPADRIGKPGRPLPSGRLDVRAAWSVVAALTVLTVVSSATLGIVAFAVAVLLLCLAFGYSYLFKNTVLTGNLVVGVVSCATLVFGALTSGRVTTGTSVAAGVILLFVVAYEIVKTLQDRDSDAAAGIRTLATRYAPTVSVAAFSAVATALSAVALGAAPLVSSTPLLCLLLLLSCLIAPVLSCAWLLHVWPDRHRSTARSLLILRLAWFPGLMSLTSMT